jgi:hypothetical protein
MNDKLKTKILRSKFVDRLRTEMVIDQNEYQPLCEALKELAVEWRGVSYIDKDVAQDLYVLPQITKNVAQSLVSYQPEMARKIEEMAMELDALILDCLGS